MAKLITTAIANLSGNPSSAETAINNNNTAIEAAVENTLSRDGTTPNTMSANLDMNSNKIVNLTTPTADTDAATKAYADSIAAGEVVTGATIDNSIIGATTPAAATVTEFTSNGIDDNADTVSITIDDFENVYLGPKINRATGSVGCIHIANASTNPAANPSGGGVLYVSAGALRYRGSSGTTTTIANA